MTAKTKHSCPLCDIALEMIERINGKDEVKSPVETLHVIESMLTAVLHAHFEPKKPHSWEEACTVHATRIANNLKQMDEEDAQSSYH